MWFLLVCLTRANLWQRAAEAHEAKRDKAAEAEKAIGMAATQGAQAAAAKAAALKKKTAGKVKGATGAAFGA